jgi:WD40 repeat protein
VTGDESTERLNPDVPRSSDRVLADREPAGPGPTTAPGCGAIPPGGSQVSAALLSGRRAPFFRSVAQIGRQAAQGLAYAHASGLVHRDIKPSNLLLDHAGVVWIADFGLAKGEDEGLTHTGDILGTLRYMAPERFRGEADARADVYGLGLTLYELLTLRPGFHSSDRLKLIEQIKIEEPQHPRAVDARIPRDLETIVLKAIEKDPKARYQTAEAMADDLGRFLADEPIRARQVSARERYWRWARRNPTIAVLGGGLAALLVAVSVGSHLEARRFATVAERASLSAAAERSARLDADQARKAAESAREAAQAESYRAVLSQVKALRAGHTLGWRDEALEGLARLAVMPTPRRDLVELRSEAVATLATLDVRLVCQVTLPPGDLRSFNLSPDGRTLVTAGFRRGLDFWDVHEHRQLAAASGLNVPDIYEKTMIAFLPESRGMAVATRDRGVVFTDARGVRAARPPITRGSSQPKEVAIDAGGHWIAVAWTEPAALTVHDAASGEVAGASEDSAFALSPSGRWLARVEQQVVVLQPLGSDAPSVKLGGYGLINAFAWSADSTMLAAASDDRTTTLWSVIERRQLGRIYGHRGPVNDVAFSPDGGAIATVSGDYSGRIWDTYSGRELAALPSTAWMRQIMWSSDGKYVAAISDSNQTVFLYRVTGRDQIQRRLKGHRNEIMRVAAHPRLRQFAALHMELITWDVSAGQPAPHHLGGEPGQGTAVAYSMNGSLLATACWNLRNPTGSRIAIWDSSTGQLHTKISTSKVIAYRALAFNPDGRRLASADEDGKAVVWDLLTGHQIQKFPAGGEIRAIAFFDDGRRMVTHGNDAVVICDLDTGLVERQVALQGGIRRFVHDPVRNRLVVAFDSGAIESVSLPGLSIGNHRENAHKGPVECLAQSTDGRLLATGGDDHRVVLRDPVSFEPLLDFPGWNGKVRDMAFDASSRLLAVVGSDPDVEVWDVGALSDGLTDLGLAWDRPTAAAVGAAGATSARPWSAPEVVVIHPTDMAPCP